jgi:hypothetical protein
MSPTRPARTMPANAPLESPPLGVGLDECFAWVGDALELDTTDVLVVTMIVAAQVPWSIGTY